MLDFSLIKDHLPMSLQTAQIVIDIVKIIQNCKSAKEIDGAYAKLKELSAEVSANKETVDKELSDFFLTIPRIGIESEVLLVTTVVIRITDQVSKFVDLKPTLESDLDQNNIPARVEDLYENTILLSYDEPTDKDEVQELIGVVKNTLSGYGTDIRSITYI